MVDDPFVWIIPSLLLVGALALVIVIKRELDRPASQNIGNPSKLEEWQRDVELRHAQQMRLVLRSGVIAIVVLGVGLSVAVSNVRQLSQSIQDERLASIVRSCQETNSRHDRSIKELRAQTVDPWTVSFASALIDTLAPLRADCEKEADSRVKIK